MKLGLLGLLVVQVLNEGVNDLPISLVPLIAVAFNLRRLEFSLLQFKDEMKFLPRLDASRRKQFNDSTILLLHLQLKENQ